MPQPSTDKRFSTRWHSVDTLLSFLHEWPVAIGFAAGYAAGAFSVVVYLFWKATR